MDREKIARQIKKEILISTAQKSGQGFIPVAVSNRHVHLDGETALRLFGQGYRFHEWKRLSQPGQFACAETIILVGPKGKIERVRVLGPLRNSTQVEISATDARQLGIKPVVRLSGDLDNTPGIRMIGAAGSVELGAGVIVAARHLHISTAQALAYGLKDGDVLDAESQGLRGIILRNVAVRVGDGHDLELHIDFDEANCAGISDGDLLKVL